MKTIIAGSRTITDPALLNKAVEMSGFTITRVVSGCADGVDRLGSDWAKAHQIPVEYMPADWKHHGLAAGPIRNTRMARAADALIALWDGRSPGTRNMIDTARMFGLRVFVLSVDRNGNYVEELVPSEGWR